MIKFLKAFTYAWMGIKHGVISERNIKLHLLAAAIVIVVGLVTGLSRIEWTIIIIVIALMLALELMNTALERTVDLVTKEFHPLAKQAKDLAAGAVLLFAVASVIIGLLIFLPKWFI